MDIKATVASGKTLNLQGNSSVLIGVKPTSSDPGATLMRTDDSTKLLTLRSGRNHVIHSKRGLSLLANVGQCDLEVTSPAPSISPPDTDSDPDW
jgi:hypothetical protein